MSDGLNRQASSWRRSGLPNQNRLLRLPLESTWLLFLGLCLCGLSSGIIEDFRHGAKPILVRFPAVCSPNVISALTNAKHQSLIHRTPDCLPARALMTLNFDLDRAGEIPPENELCVTIQDYDVLVAFAEHLDCMLQRFDRLFAPG